MTTASASILVPTPVTRAMLAAGTTVPVVDTTAGEVAWAAGTAYTVGARVNFDASIWECVLAHTDTPPGTDATRWLRFGPSNRMAPFDDRPSTRAQGKGLIKFEIGLGFFNGFALYGLVGENINIKVLTAPGGDIAFERDQDLFDQAKGLFEYLFLPLRPLTQLQVQDLPLLPDGQLHIAITAPESGVVEIGMIAVGFWETLLGSGDFGGVQYGASTEIKTYSYFKENPDGSIEITPRGTAREIRASVMIDANEANAAADLLANIASTPVAFIASGLPRYDYLNTFGLVSGGVSAENFSTASVNLTIKGFVFK
jgi:hypothetical protein